MMGMRIVMVIERQIEKVSGIKIKIRLWIGIGKVNSYGMSVSDGISTGLRFGSGLG